MGVGDVRQFCLQLSDVFDAHPFNPLFSPGLAAGKCALRAFCFGHSTRSYFCNTASGGFLTAYQTLNPILTFPRTIMPEGVAGLNQRGDGRRSRRTLVGPCKRAVGSHSMGIIITFSKIKLHRSDTYTRYLCRCDAAYTSNESYCTQAARAYGALAWAYQSTAATPLVATLSRLCNSRSFHADLALRHCMLPWM